MLEGTSDRRLFATAELSQLRSQAIKLFERCLTNGDAMPMVEFIEQQLAQRPPRVQLLRDLAEDLQQRLFALREYHFDVRDRVVRTLSESYGVDITPLAPPSELDRYHHLTTQDILDLILDHATLSPQDVLLIQNMIDASLRMASQLYSDIELTRNLYSLVSDWANGLSVEIVRHHWEQHPQATDEADSMLH